MKNPCFALLLLIGLLVNWACDSAKPAKAVAQPAPPWSSPPKAKRPAAPTVSSDATNVAWLDGDRLMPVLELATRKKRPVFVEFYAPWCAPCKVMEEDIFTQTLVFQYLNANFLNFRTDFDSAAGRTIAEIYEVEKLPTVLFLASDGVVLERHTGIANPSVLKALGDSALGKLGK